MACKTSSSCRGTTPPVQAAPPSFTAMTPAAEGTLGTLPTGTFPAPCPPDFAPSAAAINCNNFWGSLSHSLNSGPSDCAAICAAILISPVAGSAATNFTSLIRIEACLLSPNVCLIFLATS